MINSSEASFVYIISAILAFVLAQTLKIILAAAHNRKALQLKLLIASGNMPSGHAATVVALTTAIALHDGIDSPLFAIALIFSMIVMYDAMMVRRAVGEYGTALRDLLKQNVRVMLGHRPLEVGAGALLGLGVAIIVDFFVT